MGSNENSPHPFLACQLALPLCKSCFGNYIVKSHVHNFPFMSIWQQEMIPWYYWPLGSWIVIGIPPGWHHMVIRSLYVIVIGTHYLHFSQKFCFSFSWDKPEKKKHIILHIVFSWELYHDVVLTGNFTSVHIFRYVKPKIDH